MASVTEIQKQDHLLLQKIMEGQHEQGKMLTDQATAMAKLGSVMESLGRDLNNVTESHFKLSADYNESKRAPYNLLLTAIGLIFIIIGGATWYISDNIAKSELLAEQRHASLQDTLTDKLQRNQDRLDDHMQGGHPDSVEAKIEALKEKLTAEIKNTETRFDRREKRFEEYFDRIDDRLEELTKRVYPLYKEGQPY